MKHKLMGCPEKELSKSREILATCKRMKFVPEGCYLSGSIVAVKVRGLKDPCDTCRGDRDICKGRDQK